MDPEERYTQGAHYTTEKNILKVIEPLFLDDLRTEFMQLKSRKTKREERLRTFQAKLGGFTFLDPACGCGNFLVIACRELRVLELEALKELHPSGQLNVPAEMLSVVNVDQFHGIELGEFHTRIAETALWMMDHIMNNHLSLAFGQVHIRIQSRFRQISGMQMRWKLTGRICFRRRLVIMCSAIHRLSVRSSRRRISAPRCGRSQHLAEKVARWIMSQPGSFGQVSMHSVVRYGSALSPPTQSSKASKCRSSGRSCSVTTSLRSPLPIARLLGAQMHSVWRMCMW